MSEVCSHSVDSSAKKLLNSLDCLLIEHFIIQDKTVLEKLLTSLQNADELIETIQISTHRQWFASVVDIYQRQTSVTKNWSTQLYSFALKYLAILVKSNSRLISLIEAHTLKSMINQIDVSSLKESSIFNAYMSLLQTLNTHKLGLEYIFQEGLWKNILHAIHGLIVPAKYVEIQSSQYIADLIYKSFEYEMTQYCKPLLEELFLNLHSINVLIANQRIKELSAYNVYVKTLILTLEKCIGTKYELEVCQKIVNTYFLSDILLNIKKLLNFTPILLKNYITLHLLFDCFTVWHHSDMESILKSIFSLTNTPNDVQIYKQINNLFVQAIKYAKFSNAKLASDTTFEKELIIGQLLPIKKCTEWFKFSMHEKPKFEYSRTIESKCVICYCENYNSILNEVAISSIINILDIVPILKQETLDYLVTFFSTLTNQFLLSDNWLEPQQDQNLVYSKFLEILSYVFICWTKILECKLSVEFVARGSLLVPLVHSHSQFFDKPFHNSILLQNGLKLITTAFNKKIYESMPDTNNFTAFDKLCTTLNNLLLDTRPEIRDSCLQCISSIIVNSKHSSENFVINIILEKKIPISVLNTFEHDSDPFVRSKALECLENMVSIRDIWETLLKESALINHCLNLMQYESEGIIRRQIVKFITALIISNELSDKLFNEICIVMVHVSIKDPLWEVKTFTYEFWDYVIQKFTNKCSVLNNSEQLYYNLIKLSAIGCLHVLYIALQEECDLVVQKKAINLTKNLLVSLSSINNLSDIDFKFKTQSINSQKSSYDNLENCTDFKQKKMRHINSTDRVLNSITITNDCELLPSLKSTNSSNIYSNDTCLHQKTDLYISYEDFLNFTNTYNFDDCDTKTQWVIFTRSGLDSMLNDIIDQSKNCFIEGADLIDCY